MKIELNIDASNFGDTIQKVFENLTEEDRKELAKEVMGKYLLEDYKAERLAKSQEIIRELREKGDSSYRNNSEQYKNLTDEQIMSNYNFKDRAKNIKTSKEEMIKMITDATLIHYKDLVTQSVKEDTQMQEIFAKVKIVIQESYPGYVHDAMIKAFTEHFKHSFDTYMNQSYQYTNFNNDLQLLKNKLNL